MTATPEPTATSTPTPEPTATSTPTPTPEPTATSTPTPTPEPTATSTPTPTPEPTATPVPVPEDTYAKGVITENGFESEWMNLRFTKQKDVTMATQAELDDVMRQGAEVIFGEAADLNLLYAKLTTVTEMMAKYATGANIIIQTELLPGDRATMTEMEYLSTMVALMQNNVNSMATTTDGIVYEWEIGGEIYHGLTLTGDYGNGVQVAQELIVRKKESRMIVISVSYAVGIEASEADAVKLLSVLGSYDSEPIVLPEEETEVTPTDTPQVSGTFDLGVVTENGYENEWLNMRFTAPEGVTITDASGDDSVEIIAEWELGIPTVQIVVEQVNMDIDSYLDLLEASLTSVAGDGMVYTADEERYIVEIGGHEYTDLVMSIDAGGVTISQDYCVREQDGCMVAIIFTYTEGYDQELTEAIAGFGIY